MRFGTQTTFVVRKVSTESARLRHIPRRKAPRSGWLQGVSRLEFVDLFLRDLRRSSIRSKVRLMHNLGEMELWRSGAEKTKLPKRRVVATRHFAKFAYAKHLRSNQSEKQNLMNGFRQMTLATGPPKAGECAVG